MTNLNTLCANPKTVKAGFVKPCLVLILFSFSMMQISFAYASDLVRATLSLSKSSETFERDVRPILNGRCVACHSCYDAPCQLNLQSIDGIARGALSRQVYNSARVEPEDPTRIFEDAQTLKDWHAKGFYSVLSSVQPAGQPNVELASKHASMLTDQSSGESSGESKADADKDSIFLTMIHLAKARDEFPTEAVRDNRTCAVNPEAAKALTKKPELAMPYALPALSEHEERVLTKWAASVQRQADREMRPLSLKQALPSLQREARNWETFLNQTDLKHRLVARYLFEHLYLGHFMAPDISSQHLKLVRSSHKCEDGIRPVQARNANSDPGVSNWYYCFYLDPSTTVYKNHIIYPLSGTQLAWLEKTFFAKPWAATEFPSFAADVATNPFKAFREIPILARDQFMLHDSRFFVMTFIKGPVCNGSIAVNVIQEQFYVFFQAPEHDVMVNDKDYADAVIPLMTLPAQFKDGDLLSSFKDYKQLAEWHNRDLDLKSEARQQLLPNGEDLNGIWNGEGENPNAVLTVFRHDDNAEVQFGARGDLPKTVFVLDYSIFERMVYDLVVNFDVFGNLKHQSLTRLYMDFLRMGAEDNYLSYLPSDYRLQLKKLWYEGALTNKKLKLLHEFEINQTLSAVQYGTEDSEGSFHLQLIKKILFERLNAKTRGPVDSINWKKLLSLYPKDNPLENDLAKIAAVTAIDSIPFARFFPENSILTVVDRLPLSSRAAHVQIYSILHNREHQNVSWMFGEDDRLSPIEDSLTIEPGIMGGYINQFFRVERKDVSSFVRAVLAIKKRKDYDSFEKTFSVARDSLEFWPNYDNVQRAAKEANPHEFGVLDLSRLMMKKGARDPQQKNVKAREPQER